MPMTATPPDGAEKKRITHMRQILLWPVELIPANGRVDGIDRVRSWANLLSKAAGSPWSILDDEFGDPKDFQERHYNEFASFLPPVQRFLYGQPLDGSPKKNARASGKADALRPGTGGSAITVLRRCDIAGVRLTLDEGSTPIDYTVAHVDLHLFDDLDIAILAVEVYANDIDFDTGLEALFRFGRAYPAYWEPDGRGGHCPWQVEWLDVSGKTLSVSDYQNRSKFLAFVCEHRAPAIAAHWEFMLAPLDFHMEKSANRPRFRQLEYYRMPYMVFLALPDPKALSRADHIRLALGNAPGQDGVLPYSSEYLKDFETRYSYDRYLDEPGQALPAGMSHGVRYMAAGNTLVTIGSDQDPFFMGEHSGYLSRFRHQHFLMFLIAHIQKAGLRLFSDRLIAAASKLDARDDGSALAFQRTMRVTHEHFLRFAQRAWFHEISNQAQMRELFAMTRKHLELEPLFSEVREELQDMGNFLDMDAMRRQNETVVRLTVVTTFGLMGTVATGLLGMNIIAWAEEPLPWRIGVFVSFLTAIVALTLYTVVKSRRLSEFLDTLSDERASSWQTIKAFFRVWFGGRRPR